MSQCHGKVECNFKVVVALPVFQKELLLISRILAFLTRVGWVEIVLRARALTVPSLSHHLTMWCVKNGHLQNLCQSSHPLKTDLGE